MTGVREPDRTARAAEPLPGATGSEPFPQAAGGWDQPADLTKAAAEIPDAAGIDVPDELRAQIEDYMSRYPDYHSAAIPALMAAQKHHGWCSDEAIKQVACVMQVTPAYLSSVATFYDMLRTKPAGSRYVYVCTSVACHLRQADEVYAAIKAAAEMAGLDDVEVREFECLGACDMAPMASVDGRYVGPLTREDAAEIVLAVKEGRAVLSGRGLGDEGYQLPWGRLA